MASNFTRMTSSGVKTSDKSLKEKEKELEKKSANICA